MINKNELDIIKNKIVPILKRHNVTKAGIFGSYSRKENKERSDVDILIEIDNNVSLLGIINLKILLEKAIKKKIDLVEYNLIRRELKEGILNEEIPIIR